LAKFTVSAFLIIEMKLNRNLILVASAVFAFSQVQAADSWKTEAVFVSLNGNFVEVKTAARDTIVYRNTDPQMAIEWGIVHAKNTIVLAGKYLLSDRIDISRPGVILIISKDAAIELSADT